jgi:glyoxylase I family protein
VPAFSKVSHTSFSVTDAERSTSWWQELFGLVEIERVGGPGWHGIVMVHPASGTVLEVQQHDANGGDRFEPARTGLDHVGLKVDERAELDRWQAHFEAHGVTHTPVVDRDYGAVLTFKDPDGIQLEMFHRHDHP